MDSAVSRTWLLLSNFLALPCSERILSSVALAQGLCAFFFPSLDYFYSPSCQWVSLEHGAHTKRETCRVTLPWARPAWYRSLGQGLPTCPLPLLPGRVSLGEAYWCQQLLGTMGGDLTLNSALCASNSVHLDTGENLYAGCCQLSFGCK